MQISGMIFAVFSFMKSELEVKLIEEIFLLTEQLIELARKGNDEAKGDRIRLFFKECLMMLFMRGKKLNLNLKHTDGLSIIKKLPMKSI